MARVVFGSETTWRCRGSDFRQLSSFTTPLKRCVRASVAPISIVCSLLWCNVLITLLSCFVMHFVHLFIPPYSTGFHQELQELHRLKIIRSILRHKTNQLSLVSILLMPTDYFTKIPTHNFMFQQFSQSLLCKSKLLNEHSSDGCPCFTKLERLYRLWKLGSPSHNRKRTKVSYEST